MPHDKLWNADRDVFDREHDLEQYREEHWNIFGHLPPDDPSERCEHPIHAAVRQAMNGMTLEVPFDASDVVSDDSIVGEERQNRYNDIYQATKELQRQIREEEALENARKMGLVIVSRRPVA